MTKPIDRIVARGLANASAFVLQAVHLYLLRDREIA
jgi:hypothetical protein